MNRLTQVWRDYIVPELILIASYALVYGTVKFFVYLNGGTL